MSTQIKTVETSVSKVSDELLKKYIFGANLANKISKAEAMMFIEIAKASNLNPFKREIYFVEFKNEVKFLTGYEVYLKRAEDTGLLDGWATEFKGDWKNDKNSLSCVITIWRTDRQHPFVHEVFFSEYDGKNYIWNSKPRTMLKKVAISQGFRLCFPKHLGGMPYTSDEMDEGKVIRYAEGKQQKQDAPTQKSIPAPETKAPEVTPPKELQTDDHEEHVEPEKPTPTPPQQQQQPETGKTFAKTSALPPEDRIARYCEEFQCPHVITEMIEALGFQYGHPTIQDYYVPLPMPMQKNQKHRQVFIATHIFPNGEVHKGVPLYRGFLCALSKESKQSYWSMYHYDSYVHNYAKLMAGAGNLGYNESDEQNPAAVSDVFRAFATNIARQQIDAVTKDHLWKDDRLTLNIQKDLAHIYMDYFLPLPLESDPNYKTMCLYRQLISGGKDGASAGTAMVDGKITKKQANRFLMNMVYAIIARQKTIDAVLQGEGWNLMGFPNIGPRNLSTIAPILANLAKRIKEM
jgi:phage recombination protein Bet